MIHFSRSTLLVKIDTLGKRELMYEPGDHVVIFPSNDVTLVDRLLKRLSNAADPDKPIHIEMYTEESGRIVKLWKKQDWLKGIGNNFFLFKKLLKPLNGIFL